MYRTDFWTLWEKARGGWSERIALKHVYYQVWKKSPAQVGCMRQVLRAGALRWPWGMEWGGRWEGGSGWGTHVNPWLIHVNVWQKPLQYCKVIQLSSVAQSYPTLCDPMNRNTPGLPAHHKLPEFTRTHAHQVSEAIQPSHPLLSPSPPAPNPSQHQGLFHWVNSSHEVAKLLEFQLQYQSFQWIPRTDLLQDGLVGSSCSPRDSQESSPTP